MCSSGMKIESGSTEKSVGITNALTHTQTQTDKDLASEGRQVNTKSE